MKKYIPILLIATTLLGGCASYRTSSNITTGTSAKAPESTPVLISEDSLPNRKYREIGVIEVSVKKLTLFHADPTKEQANDALTEKARAIGADAVINVTYQSGIGLTTWGYMDATGTGVALLDKSDGRSAQSVLINK